MGFFLSLFGLRLIKPTVFVVGTITATIILLFLMYTVFLDDNFKDSVFWAVVSISLILSIFIGCLLAASIKIGVAVLGGWAGWTLGVMLYRIALF
mmetsp:Transcript_38415/g.52161  ORF Transcript_38415/g.52161 Transcript_38415/m.52161 type:complete len:95 (+) Transcript_38415:573-857(+)